jgi:hypothetical protein
VRLSAGVLTFRIARVFTGMFPRRIAALLTGLGLF